MGVLRIEPARAQAWAARSIGTIWRAYDLQLTIYALLLVAIGLAMAYSNSIESNVPVLGAGSTFVRGLMWAGLAGVVFAVATAFDYTWFRTFAWPIYFVNLGLLGVTLAVGDGVGGVARWVAIGPLQVQFSEIAKILMIVVLAAFLSKRQADLNSPWPILAACLLIGPPMVLVLLQPDLGTSLVFLAIVGGMLFLSGASLRWLGVLTAIAIAVVPIAWTYVLQDYQKQRLISFLYPEADPQGSGYQLLQSQISVGSGGLIGKGLTNGTQDRGNFLPVQTTDFVFAKLGEELGFIGALVVFLLFSALIWRVLVAGWRSRDPFGLCVAAGIASMVLFQFVINVGMVIGVMPITGIPLPFVTHGGASLISLAFALGILQSINIRQIRAEW
jgi:rod shape determining protein RodA